MIPSNKKQITNFGRALWSEALCLRPEDEKELALCPKPNLARGAGLSYSDCCFNSEGYVIDTSRLNHLISFDENSQILSCQGAVTFYDLMQLHPEFIPPVIPGTLYATLAGGVANDIHGKNNHHEGSIGQHIAWIELLCNGQILRCSKDDNSELFYATIGGLGLTGIITKIGLKLRKASKFVTVSNKVCNSLSELIHLLATEGLNYDYQVAWMDLLNQSPTSLVSLANHCDTGIVKKTATHSVPKFPFSLVYDWNMKLFNRMYASQVKSVETQSLQEFNNPLDSLAHWNRVYGPKGLIQFQAVFSQEQALATITKLQEIMKQHKASPMLAVLKLFTRPGVGLLSFCQAGFTLAIDFKYNEAARKAIRTMNQYISEQAGKIYLAKDLELNQDQFQTMYPNYQKFQEIITENQSGMRSDMATRLGIII